MCRLRNIALESVTEKCDRRTDRQTDGQTTGRRHKNMTHNATLLGAAIIKAHLHVNGKAYLLTNAKHSIPIYPTFRNDLDL